MKNEKFIITMNLLGDIAWLALIIFYIDYNNKFLILVYTFCLITNIISTYQNIKKYKGKRNEKNN